MRLMFGSYQFPDGQVAVTPRVRTDLDSSGRPIRYAWTITADGMLLLTPGTTDANAPQVMSQLELTMRRSVALVGQDLVLYDQFGRITSIVFRNDAYAIDYLQCNDLNFGDGGSGELVTKRSFSATFTVTYEASGRAGSWTSYQEDVQIHGNGGRTLAWQPSINGPPVPIETAPESTIRIVVSGSCVGWNGPPNIPNGPLPAQFLLNPQTAISRQSPRRYGRQLRDYPVSWHYIYEGRAIDLRPNNIVPRVWPRGL